MSQAFNGSFIVVYWLMCVQKWYTIRYAQQQTIDLQGHHYIGITPFWT